MPFSKLRAIVKEMYGPALSLRSVLPLEERQVIQRNVLFACAFLFCISSMTFAVGMLPVGNVPGVSLLVAMANRIYGLFLIVLSVGFVLSAFEAFHRSYYFHGLNNLLREYADPEHVPTSWEVATIVHVTEDADVTGGFMASTYGQEILYRAGVSEDLYTAFVEDRTPKVTADTFVVDRDKGVVLSTYVRSLYKHDEDLRDFLSHHAINEEQLTRAAEWVTAIERRDRKGKRWWSRDNLGKVPGLAKTWSYGPTFLLEKYGHEITEDHVWHTALMTHREEDDEVEEIEQVLARGRQANVLLLTNDTISARQRTAQLYHKISEGLVVPPLEAKRVFFIDLETIIISTGEKTAFESEFRRTMDQAAYSGNTIIYFEHLSNAIQSAHTVGVDLTEMLSPYFESPSIQIIVGEQTENYNKQLAHDARIREGFDVIQMKDVAQDGVIDLLQQRAFEREKYSDIVFSIPALEKIASLADRYFPTGVMPDKAFDLLEELIPYSFTNHIEQVQANHVEAFVSKKAKVPIGEPKEEEREKLLSLEAVLHQRVVAQEQAISAVARALRRARAGVGNPKKPMGTFLFLGPTGVGKTETAKALAEVLFGDEQAMTRLDMSEFQGEQALEDLIGSYETGKPGRLEGLIRQRQYGVLLLDEFEKSNQDIHDLFLQILDEGHFTDSQGQKVNMRNLIIIATSNAGAELIWEWEKTGKRIGEAKRTLVDYIIANGLFRPELLNRFDDIVVFHALKEDHVKSIARIHLEGFAKRILKEQNITVLITEPLVEYVASKGYDPQFGGRPLARAITDEVEQEIADHILAGTLHPGETFEFSVKEKEKTTV